MSRNGIHQLIVIVTVNKIMLERHKRILSFTSSGTLISNYTFYTPIFVTIESNEYLISRIFVKYC